MRKILVGIALALLLASPLAAQQTSPTMEQLLAARATLINRYVLSSKLAVRVAICGDQDLLTGDDRDAYLCVYVHGDKMKAFFNDFINFATETSPGGSLGIDGVPVSVQLLDPAGKEIPNEQPKPNQQPYRPDNRTNFPTRKA